MELHLDNELSDGFMPQLEKLNPMTYIKADKNFIYYSLCCRDEKTIFT